MKMLISSKRFKRGKQPLVVCNAEVVYFYHRSTVSLRFWKPAEKLANGYYAATQDRLDVEIGVDAARKLAADLLHHADTCDKYEQLKAHQAVDVALDITNELKEGA